PYTTLFRSGGLELIANTRKLPLLLLELGAQGPDSLRHGLRARVERPGHLRQQVAISGDELVGGLADDHVDAAQPRADAGLGYDHRRPDVRGVPDVGAAAQLARPVVRPDPRPLLNDPFAQGFAQRLVQQMSRRVVAHDLPPPLVIDRRGRLLPHTHLAGDHSPEVRERTL